MVKALSSVGFIASLGALFYWLSLPPLRQPWAAYLAVACWTFLIAKQTPLQRNDYVRIWLISSAMWLVLLQGIRLANPILYPGWIALSLYVAIYIPLFLGTARYWTHTLRFPLAVAIPVSWVAGELVRAYFATGFSACMLAHSQTPWPFLLTVASHLGSYGVSFFVAIGGVAIALWGLCSLRSKSESTFVRVSAIEASVATSLVVVWAMGSFQALRLYDTKISMEPPSKLGKFLVVQADMPTAWDVSLEELKVGWERYEQQTRNAVQTYRDESIDVVLWPESAFTGGIIEWDRVPFDFSVWQIDSASQFSEYLQRNQENFQLRLQIVLEPFGAKPPALLVGSNVLSIQDGEFHSYNAAVFLKPTDPMQMEYYAKRHLVMFGEYVPVVCWFPSFCSQMGLPLASVGKKAQAFQLASGAIISPTICFEDVVPQMVRSNIVERTQPAAPNVLVNLTNDGWFRGSSILDHHMNNAILAAVENRRPMLIAANHGISAWIDGNGRVIRQLPRLESGAFLAEPIQDGRWGAWQKIGDWPAKIVAIICLLPCVIGLAKHFLKRRHLSKQNRS